MSSNENSIFKVKLSPPVKVILVDIDSQVVIALTTNPNGFEYVKHPHLVVCKAY